MVALPSHAIEMPDHLWEIGAADPHGLSVGIDCLVSIDDFFTARRRCPSPDAPHATVGLSCRMQVQAFTVGVGNDGDLVAAVAQIVAAYDGALLDDLPPFRDAEPSLARLAAVIFQQLDHLLSSTLKVLDAVTVWETPTLSVTIRRGSGR